MRLTVSVRATCPHSPTLCYHRTSTSTLLNQTSASLSRARGGGTLRAPRTHTRGLTQRQRSPPFPSFGSVLARVLPQRPFPYTAIPSRGGYRHVVPPYHCRDLLHIGAPRQVAATPSNPNSFDISPAVGLAEMSFLVPSFKHPKSQRKMAGWPSRRKISVEIPKKDGRMATRNPVKSLPRSGLQDGCPTFCDRI
jgi:hypothetical protein